MQDKGSVEIRPFDISKKTHGGNVFTHLEQDYVW